MKIGLEPWVGNEPKVLILGTLPSDDSIRYKRYYANPTNRFWEVMHNLFGGDVNDHSKDFIISQRIALWDCFKSAIRKDSADKYIIVGTETPNDILSFLGKYSTIETIVLNGTTIHPHEGFSTITAFDKYFYELHKQYNIIPLPQTSRRNVGKLDKWSVIKDIVNAKF